MFVSIHGCTCQTNAALSENNLLLNVTVTFWILAPCILVEERALPLSIIQFTSNLKREVVSETFIPTKDITLNYISVEVKLHIWTQRRHVEKGRYVNSSSLSCLRSRVNI
jgi:hypothetical protein